jgi:hypothetical protein
VTRHQLTLPAERRMPLPPRTCQGFYGTCGTPKALLSQYNTEALCAVCARKRGDAIAEQRHKPSAEASTHCAHGHLYTIASTYWSKRGRQCRICSRERERKYA